DQRQHVVQIEQLDVELAAEEGPRFAQLEGEMSGNIAVAVAAGQTVHLPMVACPVAQTAAQSVGRRIRQFDFSQLVERSETVAGDAELHVETVDTQRGETAGDRGGGPVE